MLINNIYEIAIPEELASYSHMINTVEDMREQGGRVLCRLAPGYRDKSTGRHFVRSDNFHGLAARLRTNVGRCSCGGCNARLQHRN